MMPADSGLADGAATMAMAMPLHHITPAHRHLDIINLRILPVDSNKDGDLGSCPEWLQEQRDHIL
jgi:hypothetical protein